MQQVEGRGRRAVVEKPSEGQKRKDRREGAVRTLSLRKLYHVFRGESGEKASDYEREGKGDETRRE